jgi:hypothetical protein
MRVLSALSGILFILGCMVILVAIIGAWAYLMVLTATQSVVAGWVLFIFSMAGWSWYQVVLQAPWAAWFKVWNWGDAAIHRRILRAK